MMNNDDLKLKLKNIKLILLDVDGTMTDGGIYVLPDGSQIKRFHAHDGEGIRRALEKGIEVGIISAAGLAKHIIEARANILGIKRVHAERCDKLVIAQQWATEMNLPADEVAFMGDDIIDLTVMQWCGIAAAPKNAHHSILPYVHIITQKNGGDGAVREFIDMIIE